MKEERRQEKDKGDVIISTTRIVRRLNYMS